MNDSESLIDTLKCLETKENGEELVKILNIIANLMRDIDNRPSKATYARTFTLGKLRITTLFDGMK